MEDEIDILERQQFRHPVTQLEQVASEKELLSGNLHGSNPEMKPIWQALYEYGADVVLNGHEHNYERFEPQTPEGVFDPERGIRQFVVGTGGYGALSLWSPHC